MHLLTRWVQGEAMMPETVTPALRLPSWPTSTPCRMTAKETGRCPVSSVEEDTPTRTCGRFMRAQRAMPAGTMTCNDFAIVVEHGLGTRTREARGAAQRKVAAHAAPQMPSCSLSSWYRPPKPRLRMGSHGGTPWR